MALRMQIRMNGPMICLRTTNVDIEPRFLIVLSQVAITVKCSINNYRHWSMKKKGRRSKEHKEGKWEQKEKNRRRNKTGRSN